MIETYRNIRERLDDRNRRLLDVFLFFSKFVLLALPLYLLVWSGWNPVWLRQLNASIAAHILSLTGITATSTATVVHTDHMFVDISVDSTGWKSFMALSALMLAVKGYSIRKRLYGVAGALMIVFAGNIARIVSMIYAVEVWHVSYELLHTLLWRWGLTVIVFVSWLLWMRWDHEASEERVRTLFALFPWRE